MTVHLQDDAVTLHAGDCLDVLRGMADASMDAVVTDPPYGLAEHSQANIERALLAWLTGDREHVPDGRGFMSRAWDAFVPPPAVWDECFRVLKPGGHLLAFAGSRTHDLMAMSIRLAGFEKRDSIAWVYASGFPKSLDVSKAIDKAAGAEREVVSLNPNHRPVSGVDYEGVYAGGNTGGVNITAPATDAARQWQGWGTALKPAFEPIVVARKPLAGTVAQTVTAWGTGALNIDACRVGTDGGTKGATSGPSTGILGDGLNGAFGQPVPGLGRWPSNLVLSHAATPDGLDLCADGCVDGCPVRELDQQSGVTTSPASPVTQGKRRDGSGWDRPVNDRHEGVGVGYADSGGASRFFPTFRYEPKAPTAERPRDGGTAHPTVKPLDLMRWLVRLVTPPGGTVLDPFAGSGTTGEACVLEGFHCVLIEREPTYLPLIVARLSKPLQQDLFGGAA